MLSDLLISLERGVAPLIALIFLGFLWRIKTPAGLSVMDTRRTINALVLYLFYPGLAFDVISRAHFGLEVIWVPLSVWVSLLATLGVGWLVFARYRTAWGLTAPGLGALLIAGSFGNILSMGIAVLQSLFGPDAARYAIYADVLGISILFWTLGAGMAAVLGAKDQAFRLGAFALTLLKMPPIWAFFAGLMFNLLAIPVPEWLKTTSHLLGQAVVPSMLLTVGMSISLATVRRSPKMILTASAIKLVVMPALVAAIVLPVLGMSEMTQVMILLAGMPTMMATVLLAERFGLDTELLAAVMVVSTLGFFFTLPVMVILLL
jgi:predicted permease